MKKKLVIIFDFDGTIANTLAFIEKATIEIFGDSYFKGIKKVNLSKLKNKESREVFKSLGIPLAKIPFILKKVSNFVYQEIDKVKPIAGMKEALSEIKENGHSLGILTSSPLKTVAKFLTINGFDFFDFVCSENNLFGKAKALKKILKERKLAVESVFYVGDEVRDIKAAQAAKIKIVAVNWGFNNEVILKKQAPDFLIKKPAELVALFANF